MVLLAIFLPVSIATLALQSHASISEFFGIFPNAYAAFLVPTIPGGVAYILVLRALEQWNGDRFGLSRMIL